MTKQEANVPLSERQAGELTRTIRHNLEVYQKRHHEAWTRIDVTNEFGSLFKLIVIGFAHMEHHANVQDDLNIAILELDTYITKLCYEQRLQCSAPAGSEGYAYHRILTKI